MLARASWDESVESQSGFPFSSTRVADALEERRAAEEPVAVKGVGGDALEGACLAAVEGVSSGVDSAAKGTKLI